MGKVSGPEPLHERHRCCAVVRLAFQGVLADAASLEAVGACTGPTLAVLDKVAQACLVLA